MVLPVAIDPVTGELGAYGILEGISVKSILEMYGEEDLDEILQAHAIIF